MTTPQEPPAAAHPSYHPSLRDMLMLSRPSDVKISADGARLAFTVQVTNWQDNCYESRCVIHDLDSGTTTPITRTGSVSQMAWVDDCTLAVLWSDYSCEPQVRLFEQLVGEGWQVTHHKGGVAWFEPFAGGILYRAQDPGRREQKERKDRFGQFTHFEREPSASALYYVGLAQLRAYQALARASTEDEVEKLIRPVVELSRLFDEPLSIQSVVPARAGDAIYLTCRSHDDLVYYRETSSFRITLDAQSALNEHLRRQTENHASEAEKGTEGDGEDFSYLGTLTRLAMPKGATIVGVSPDGARLLVAHRERDLRMFTREDAWLIDVEDALAAPDADAFVAAMRNLTASLDRSVVDGGWFGCGIFSVYADGTTLRAARLDEDGTVRPIDFGRIHPASGLHVSDTGRLAFVGASAVTVPEIYVADLASAEPDLGSAEPDLASAEPDVASAEPDVASADSDVPSRRVGDTGPLRAEIAWVTNFGKMTETWDLGTVETVRWESRDGSVIEGALRKPVDFDPTRRYPLVIVVHGGPQWLSTEYLLSGDDLRTYPSVQFVAKDVLVLKPNYRGSIGRGQAFAELNVNNLGVGDLWDIESAVDHLVGLGWVDPDRVGCMGWSQGGYISAFAGLHSDKFRAVSVGAGISDWYTYHISNDIPDFTLDYLSGSPFRDRERYLKTAPISALATAHTPMLIQHGSDDRRVPLSNAMELYRGLKEMGVPVELYVYPGMGHPITRPRENHAVMHQNLTWFSRYLLGEDE